MGAELDRVDKAAQEWHKDNHGAREGSGFSDCFCCCTLCDPDWKPAVPNPHWHVWVEAVGRSMRDF